MESKKDYPYWFSIVGVTQPCWCFIVFSAHYLAGRKDIFQAYDHLCSYLCFILLSYKILSTKITMLGTPKKVSLSEAGIVTVEGMKVICKDKVQDILSCDPTTDGFVYFNDGTYCLSHHLETIVIEYKLGPGRPPFGKPIMSKIPLSLSDLQTILDKDLLGKEVEFEIDYRGIGIYDDEANDTEPFAKLIQPKERLFTLEEVKEKTLEAMLFVVGPMEFNIKHGIFSGREIEIKNNAFWQQQGLDK